MDTILVYDHDIKFSENFDKVVLHILYNHEHLSRSDKAISETHVSHSEDVHEHAMIISWFFFVNIIHQSEASMQVCRIF